MAGGGDGGVGVGGGVGNDGTVTNVEAHAGDADGKGDGAELWIVLVSRTDGKGLGSCKPTWRIAIMATMKKAERVL